MLTHILFDLDGTLLPMDQDVFVKCYLSLLSKNMAVHGYDPQKLVKAVWDGTDAMYKNNGSKKNFDVFWKVFAGVFGEQCMLDMPLFDHFYQNAFQEVRTSCGFDARCAEIIRQIHCMGIKTVLATNPLFPKEATYSRMRWAGLNPEDFELITTYENSRYCKPELNYYRDILDELHILPENCMMVGNDVDEDMAARGLGMKVFLLTDNLINRHNSDLSSYPHGSFPELLNYIRTNLLL